MKAIEISKPGGPEVLTLVDRPTPAVGPDDVLIKVAAAGVNRPDVMQRRGHYPVPPGAPDIPGLEVAGEITEVGSAVGGWSVGDRVCALFAGGGYSEYCTAPAPQCLLIPPGMDAVHAAGIPETAFTVWTNVFERGRLQRGEAFLVHGGSSGIGTTAIQFAHAFGAKVFTTAGTPEKCRVCESLGADLAINYRETDFVTAVRQATDDRGVDLILDMVGADYFMRNLEALAMDGRLVLIGQLGGFKTEANLTPIMRRRLTVTGSTLRPRSVAEKGAIARALKEQVWPLYESGAVHVLVEKTFPLAQAADAHRLMESSAHTGKIVLIP